MQQVKCKRRWMWKMAVVALALAALLAFAPLALGAYAQAFTPHHRASSSGWTIVPDALGGALNNVLGASATIASNDAWVAGDHNYGGTSTTLFEHWNGVRWSIVSSPNPGNRYNMIAAMSADRSTDVWAVGSYDNENSGGNYLPLVEHWNGVRWYSIFSPVPPHSSVSLLTGVTALSATDAWSTGSYWVRESGLNIPFVEHWNGVRWSFVAIPNIGFAYTLNALKGISGSNVWAVGSQYPTNNSATPLTMHWDGVRWTVVSAPRSGVSSGFSAIVAITSTDIWAVGSELQSVWSFQRSFAEHWNGSSWQIVYTPTINSSANAAFTGVAATSSHTVWAVGYTASNTSTTQLFPFIDEWNGTNWTAVSIPVRPSMTATSLLLGVSATPQGGVWAVGYLVPLNKLAPTTLILRHS